MIKILCFMNRKPGLSREEFKTYYEEHHVPLIKRMMPFYVDYRRNFVTDQEHVTTHMVQDRSLDASFDVLTELTYADEGMYQMAIATLADPETGAIIREDEAKFLDRTAMRAFIVDERQ